MPGRKKSIRQCRDIRNARPRARLRSSSLDGNIVPLPDEIAVSVENKNCELGRRGIDIQLAHDRAIEIRDCDKSARGLCSIFFAE